MQFSLFPPAPAPACISTDDTQPDLSSYDMIVVAFSGGKDSVALVCHLLDLGVSREKIELHHHDVDGRESGRTFDWPVTADYCRKVAAALGLPIYFSWRVGGLEREMLRDQAATAPVRFETPSGAVRETGGKSDKLGTRLRFPQVSADLSVRWCSAYGKVMILDSLIRNDDRFLEKRTLVVTGERAEESAARARYKTFEPHRSDTRDGSRRARHVDHWRPIHAWDEAAVWGIIQRHGVVPHPCYFVGMGRASCAYCIFSSEQQLATMRAIDPEGFGKIASYEARFGVTIHRTKTVGERADAGSTYESAQGEAVRLAMAHEYDGPVLVDPATWTLPAGAFGESSGPS